MKTANLPAWAVKKQKELLKTRPNYFIGDIVNVDNSTDNGLGVIVEIAENGRAPEYGVDFGPKKMKVWWFGEDVLTLINRK